jgi:hypothetical protein
VHFELIFLLILFEQVIYWILGEFGSRQEGCRITAHDVRGCESFSLNGYAGFAYFGQLRRFILDMRLTAATMESAGDGLPRGTGTA